MKKLITVAILSIVLSGCAAIESSSTEGRVAAACRTYASALMVAAEHKDELSEDQIKYINDVRPSAREICQDKENYTQSAINEIAAIATRMVQIRNSLEN